LLQFRLQWEATEGIEVEYPQFRASGAVFLHQQRRLACVSLPVNLSRRIAIPEGPQAHPLFRAAGGNGRRARLGAEVSGHGERAVWTWIHEHLDWCVHPRPSAE